MDSADELITRQDIDRKVPDLLELEECHLLSTSLLSSSENEIHVSCLTTAIGDLNRGKYAAKIVVEIMSKLSTRFAIDRPTYVWL